MTKARISWLAVVAACVTGFLGVVPVAEAQGPQPSANWTCNATGARVSLLGNALLAPNVANGQNDPCVDDFATLPNVDQGTSGVLNPLLPTIRLKADGVFARTDITGEGGPTRDQVVTSTSGAASVELDIRAGVTNTPILNLQIDGLESTTTGRCTTTDPRTPEFSSDFETVTIRVNGQELSLNDALVAITTALGPLDPILDIRLGERLTDGTATSPTQSETRRGLHVLLLSAAGANPVADIVVGESIADRRGDVCAPPPPPTCPAGSTFTPGIGCVINDTQCPPGSGRTTPGGPCLVPPGSVVCPPGSTNNGQGQCVVPPEGVTCPPGSTLQQGQCVVPPGSVVCPPGSTNNGQGQCTVPPDGAQCPPGSVRQGTGTPVVCVVDPASVECPAGTIRQGNNCVVDPTSVQCPAGSIRQGNQCVVDPASVQCPAGSTRQGAACVADSATGGGGDGNTPTGVTPTPLSQLPLGLNLTNSPCQNKRFGQQLGLLGTQGIDRITGTNRSDRIFALAGSDRISGGRGNDCIEAGVGNDRADGSNGADYLLGGTGRDILNGGPNPDRIEGGVSNDKLFGGTGGDRMFGESGNDKLVGGSGNDALVGGSGNDVFLGGNGRDRVDGGAGNDIINVATAGKRSVVTCGPGRDTVRANGNDRIAKSCERVLVIREGRSKSQR